MNTKIFRNLSYGVYIVSSIAEDRCPICRQPKEKFIKQ